MICFYDIIRRNGRREIMKTKRLSQITVMNALLCLFVVMIHLTFSPLSELIIGSAPHIMIFAVNKALSFSVPAFIFLSGFKLYKCYTTRSLVVAQFLKRRTYKIVMPYFFAVLIYIAYFGIKGWLDGNIFEYLILGTISAHFYYIVVLVQLYLLFPLIFRLFTEHSRTVFAVSAFITLFSVIFLNTGYWDRFFGTYIFYFVFGMLWAKYDLYRIFRKMLYKICTAYAFIALIHICLLYLREYKEFAYRMYPIVNMIYSALAIIVLYAASKMLLKRSKTLVAISGLLGECSYSIYLYHLLVIFILKYDILPRFALSVSGRFFVMTIVLYGLIAVYCIAIHRLRREKNDY